MVRFKVIRGSHLMLALSALVLAAVVMFILFQSIAAGSEENKLVLSSGQLTQMEEAKVLETFASNSIAANSLRVEIQTDKPDAPPLSDAPTILVYHTHTHEAYEQINTDPYEAIESWRTTDVSHSVVRVGAALVDNLQRLGFFAVHDTSDHELNDIDQAYVRSLETLESYSGEFDLIIDLHRDAYSEGMPMRVGTGDEACAQVMMVVGDGGDYNHEDAPDYQRNLSFAQRLTSEMNRIADGIARNVTVKHGRFNQHIGKTALLIEVGHNRNTLDEALKSVPYLAEAIKEILR